jgi:hypothetical protein
VKTAVVVWGSAQASLPGAVVFDGVEFVPGRDMQAWLKDMEGDSVDQEPAEALLASLERYRERAWAAVVEAKSS